MKKGFTILFLLLYLVLNVGLNIMVHTCGGESEALLATTAMEDPCGCADMMSPADMCCTTELKSVTLNDVQTVTPVLIVQHLVLIGILPPEEISASNIQHSVFTILGDTSPPPDKDFQSYNSVFLI